MSRPHHPRPADHGRLVDNDHPRRNCPLNRLGVRVRRAETPGSSRRGDELGNIWPQVADARIDQRIEPDRHRKRTAGLRADLQAVQGPGQLQRIERVAAGGLVNPQQQRPGQPDTAASLQQREKGPQGQRARRRSPLIDQPAGLSPPAAAGRDRGRSRVAARGGVRPGGAGRRRRRRRWPHRGTAGRRRPAARARIRSSSAAPTGSQCQPCVHRVRPRHHAAGTPLAAPAAARSGRQAWTVSGIERSRSASPTHGSRASATVARLMSTCSPAERRSATIDSQIAVLPMPTSPVRMTAAELAPSTPSAARIDKRSVARPMRSAGSPATPLLRLQQSDLPGDLADAVHAAPAYAAQGAPGPGRG